MYLIKNDARLQTADGNLRLLLTLKVKVAFEVQGNENAGFIDVSSILT